MRYRFFLTSLAFLVGSLTWGQHVSDGMNMNHSNSSKAANHGGRLDWVLSPETGPSGVTQGFGDPRNPVVDPWEIRVTTVAKTGGENSYMNRNDRDGQSKQSAVPTTDDDSPAIRSSAAIQPLIDVEVGSTYSAGASNVPDGCAAVSNTGFIVASNNTHVEFFDEQGNVLYSEGEDTFWATNGPTANIYDPKILYHAGEDKFILLALHGSSSSLTEMYIAFSASNNPLDGWWYYKINANPGSLSSWWFDYPSIGHSEDLFISGNMFTNSDSYQATALFQMDISNTFTGGTYSTEYWSDVEQVNETNAFTVKPLQYPFGEYGPGIYCASMGNDNASINYWNVTGNVADDQLLQRFSVSAESWTSANDAAQSGTTDLLDTGGDRIRTGFYGGDGILHLAHTVERGTSNFAQLRYVKVDINTGSTEIEEFGVDNWDYAYPWIVPWTTDAATWDDGIMCGFLRVSSGSFPEFRCVHMDGDLNFGTSVSIRSGDSPISANDGSPDRWGDYIGGSWRPGQSIPEVWLYGQYGQSNDHALWLAEVVEDIAGCTDPAACNYDPDATINDSSCTFPGCTDSQACNWNLSAGCDDGSCCYGTCVSVDMELDGIFGGNDMDYSITDNTDGTEIITGTNSFINDTDQWCMEPGCYTFEITCTDPTAAWELRFSPFFILIGFDYTIYEGTGNFSGEFIVGDGGGAAGCTNPFACNYDAVAICDDGSCCFENCLTIEMTDSSSDGWTGSIWEVVDPADGSVVSSGTLASGSIGTAVACLEAGCYDFRINTEDGLNVAELGWTISGADGDAVSGDYATNVTFTIGGGGEDNGCTDPVACNYSALAVCDDGTCCYANCATLVKNDSFSDGWNGGTLNLLDTEGNILNTFEMLDGSLEEESLCLEDGCYRLVFIAGGFPLEVSWTLTMNATGNMVGGGGFYDEQFSINSADGCTDPNACNYDPAATCDDGSCDYGLWYLPNNVSDGPVTQACEAPEGYYLAVQSCIETVIAADPYCVNTNWDNICMRAYNCCLGINGCGDPGACNYDVQACWDNTLCTYGGCNDPFACNFDPLAGCDDGSCTYDCYGCTYADAENYDPTATVDDDSCTFAPCSDDCAADLNGDGEIGTPDLLDLLGSFGVTCP